MNINEIITKLRTYEKEDLVKLCLKNTDELIKISKRLELLDIDLEQGTLLQLLGCSVMLATNTDGEIGLDEYTLAKKIFTKLNIECYEHEKFKLFVAALEEQEGLSDAPATVCKIFSLIAEDGERAKELFVELFSAVALYNGKLDDSEVAFIHKVVGETAPTQSKPKTSPSRPTSATTSSFSTNSPKNIEIIKHNASLTRDDDCYYLSVGAELKNPNISKVAQNVEVRIIVKDSSGRILETDRTTIECIDSNATFYFGTECYISRGTPANYTIQVISENFVNSPSNSTYASGITASHYNVSQDRWSTTFTANVHNGYNRRLYVSMFFVFYDDAGNITGGANTYIGTMYSNSDDNAEIYLRTVANRSRVRASASFDFRDLM